MKTRFLSLFLTVAVLCSCMAVTVGASEIEVEQQQFINVLDFATPNDSGNYYVTTNSSGIASATFELPYGTIIRYVDMYVASARAITNANLTVGSVVTSLTVEAVSGTTYYRIYGTCSAAYASSFSIDIDTGVGEHYVQFFSLHMSPQALSIWSAPSTFLLEDQSVTQTYGTSLVTLEYTYDSNIAGMNAPWTSSVRNTNWRKYDFMTFTLSYFTHSINNISVMINSVPVPFTVNMVENPPDFNGYTDPDYGLGNAVNIYSVSVTVDLTGVNRTQTQDLIVTIQGMGTFCNASLHRSAGLTPADLPDAEITWLQKIWQALVGDTSASDEYRDEMESQADAMQDAVDQMDTVTKPPVDNIDVSVDSYVDADGASAAGDVIGQLMGNDLVLSMVMISMTVALVAYIIFGKKG